MTKIRKLRTALALPAAYAAWVFAFLALGFVASLFWPGLTEAIEDWNGPRNNDVPTSILFFSLFLWLVANGAAGFVAQWVGKSSRLVLIGAGLLAAYFAYNHWWVLWGVLPDWYNVVVVIPVIPTVWIGALLAQRRVSRPMRSS